MLLLLLTIGCTSWDPVAMSRRNLESKQLVGETVRVTTLTGVTEMVVTSLEYPILHGTSGSIPVSIDLNRASSVQVETFDPLGGLSDFGLVAIVLVSLVAGAIAIASL